MGREERFPVWEATLGAGVAAAFAAGLVGVYLSMPDSDYSFLKLPRNLEELQILTGHLENYTSDYTLQVLVGYCAVYIFMQTFMIPGTIFMSLLAGALFGQLRGVALVVFAASAGASSCYFLSKMIGKPLVFSLWPDKLSFFQKQVAKRRQKLLNYMLFLRVTPTLPNTFINLASPIVDVPYHIFLLATLIGLIPAAYVTVRAGIALGELTSLSDLYDTQSIALLFLIGVVSVTPALLGKDEAQEKPSETAFQCAYHRSSEKLSPTRVSSTYFTYNFMHREDQEVSYGLNWAIAGRGVVVKDKVFHNLEPSELQKVGATYPGNVISGVPDVSKAQFAKLLKLVTFHLSSISSLYVQDGAIGSSTECDAKVRVISDNPSAAMLLSKVLWKIPDRAISHDTSPLTIYAASSISSNVKTVLGSGIQYTNGFAAADIECSSLILCGKAYADSTVVKDALTALTAPIFSARGGLPVPGWLLCFGGSTVLLFAPMEIISTDAIPSVSKLSPGQAAYHFLAGYHDGRFVSAYSRAPSPADPVALASSLFSHLKEDDLPAYLINAKRSGKYIEGKEFIKLFELALSGSLPDIKTEDIRVGELKGKYRSFLSSKFGKRLPEEFSF
ncbi:hypothetical protein EJB05_39493 [Eragrostis curvula]|uniref:VTT domain-containing protein n=1 Tax=Eragrostis curvula TaxID=38414 RepID=A0A5J9TX39_9POAL|nr:hypothetical protein EJB05_39493 [Eragrostis curvula]